MAATPGPGIGNDSAKVSEVEQLPPSTRLKALFRSSTGDNYNDRQDSTDGVTLKSGRAATALANIAKGDDKLTRKAEEQVSKVKCLTIRCSSACRRPDLAGRHGKLHVFVDCSGNRLRILKHIFIK
jgi:hypothetical protein